MRLSSALAPVILLAATSSHATDNVILVTLDGVRIQELFGGMDPSLVDRPEDSGIYDPEVTRSRYWRETPGKTRSPHAVILEDARAHGGGAGKQSERSSVTVRNQHWFSYPATARS
jgi:hypothetical protein